MPADLIPYTWASAAVSALLLAVVAMCDVAAGF